MEFLQPRFGRTRNGSTLQPTSWGWSSVVAVVLLLLKLVGSYFTTRPWLYDPNWKDGVDENSLNEYETR